MAPEGAGLRPGTAVKLIGGRWKLCGPLGHGGASEVYRAVDLHLRRRPVAVKLFRQRDSRAARAALTREASALSGLHHPGVIAVYDAGMVRDHPYLVTELVDGPTLQERMDAAALAPREAARLGEQLARALAYIHQAGIAHCDLKPSNVLLDKDGRPHLADFGIARQARGAPQPGDPEAVTGTAAYLAPEQVRGAQPGRRADIYALGLVLAEALAGERMYQGAPLEAALARLQRPPTIPDRIPAQMADLLRRMTSTHPEVRPSAQECAARLGTLAQARPRPAGDSRRPPTAPPHPPAPAAPRATRSTILLVAAAAVALCVGLVCGALTT